MLGFPSVALGLGSVVLGLGSVLLWFPSVVLGLGSVVLGIIHKKRATNFAFAALQALKAGKGYLIRIGPDSTQADCLPLENVPLALN